MSDAQKLAKQTVWGIVTVCVAVVVMVAFVSPYVPAQFLGILVGAGTFAGILCAPLVVVLNKIVGRIGEAIENVQQQVAEGQQNAANRGGKVIEAVERVEKRLDTSDGMPQTLEDLRTIIRDEMTAAAPELVKETLKQLRVSGELGGPAHP